MGFDWIAKRVEALQAKSLLEAGTGFLQRYLAANCPGSCLKSGLVEAAPADVSFGVQV